MSEQEKNEALAVIKQLDEAIARRRVAEGEVGKAQRALADVRVKAANSSETLSAALKEFGEVAAHW
jgi:hypothetical protein